MCGLAAAVLHWDEAFGDTGTRGEAEEAKKEWVDVDVNGALEPAWRAFEMF